MECEKALLDAKKVLMDKAVLVPYDSKIPIVLATDASPYGLGAVISYVMEDGSERPIAYASRSLGKAEQGYSQIEKEGLAIVFGVKKFHKYLYGRRSPCVQTTSCWSSCLRQIGRYLHWRIYACNAGPSSS